MATACTRSRRPPYKPACSTMQNHLAAPRGLRSEFEDYGCDERRLPAKKKKSRRGRSDKQRFTALHTDDPGGAPYDDVEEAEARELRLRELYPEVVDPPFSEGRLDEMASPTPGGGGGNARRMGCAAGICAVLSVLAILGGLLFGGGLQVSLAKPSSAQAVVGATMPPPASPPRSAATRATACLRLRHCHRRRRRRRRLPCRRLRLLRLPCCRRRRRRPRRPRRRQWWQRCTSVLPASYWRATAVCEPGGVVATPLDGNKAIMKLLNYAVVGHGLGTSDTTTEGEWTRRVMGGVGAGTC